MHLVYILDRDICSGHADLTIVPCSGKMKQVEKPRNQQRIDWYGLPRPYDLRSRFGYGQISPIFRPTRNVGKIKYFAFAASVLNRADAIALEQIGEQLGALTVEHDDIRLIETPLLGCGDGGLSPAVAVPALASGFLRSHHPDSMLQVCSDNAVSVAIASAAINNLFDTMHVIRDSGVEVDPSDMKSTIEYDVVLSFAGEQRPFVELLSTLLKSYGVSVFYDNDERAELWGKNLYDYLFEIYSYRSRYCVILVSKEYNEKEWTNHERRAAQDRAFRERGGDYILPIRFDGTVLRSLPLTTGYLDAGIGVDKIADLILQKLR